MDELLKRANKHKLGRKVKTDDLICFSLGLQLAQRLYYFVPILAEMVWVRDCLLTSIGSFARCGKESLFKHLEELQLTKI